MMLRFCLLLFYFSSILDSEYTLSVRVNQVKVNQGKVYMALFDKNEKVVQTSVHPTGNTSIEFKFEKLPAGKYCVKVYQDLNNNQQLDKNFLGIPQEPYGLSNNIQPKFAPPAFKDMLFEVQKDTEISIHLH